MGLQHGYELKLNTNRIYAYIPTPTSWQGANDSYSILVPVVVGHKYKFSFSTTNNEIVGNIFRVGFSQTQTPPAVGQSVPLTGTVRTTPRNGQNLEVTATDSYMVIQLSAAVSADVYSNKLLVVQDIAEVQKHQLKGPVGYAIVGNPIIVDGIASGFTATDYVRIDELISKDSDIEIHIKLSTTSANTQQRFFSSSNFTARFMPEGNTIHLSIYGYNAGGTYVASGGTTTLSANTEYYVKIIGNTEGTKAYLSTDDTNYNLEIDSDLLTLKNDNDYCRIGCGPDYQLLGSIDLNETYIKVNGKSWFYQPQETRYIVKDDKLIWADPRIYIDDNGTKTYATATVAPVPAGYTFGSFTTPGIGFVDMITQQFTAAPEGVTIGRDE